MKLSVASHLVMVYLAVVLGPLPLGAVESKPNLLIIHTDEHNFRTLGCYRELLTEDQAFMWGKDAVVTTPHIDSIAERGAICTSFYATTPVCSPSRAAFVSGRYPQNTPVVTNNIPMNDEIVTFAEILSRHGYATGYAGKWHLDGTGKPQWTPERRFGFTDNRYMFNRGHWKQLEDTLEGPRVKARDAKDEPSYSVAGADEKSFATDFLADKTIEFLNKHKNKPFCFMVSLPDPHGPDSVRPPYDTMFKNQTYTVPRTFEVDADTVPSWGKPADKFLDMANYYGMVKCIDDNVGKILQTLQTNGLSEKTIVVFTSDHGDLRGEHHRQNKGVPYEASARIPFVIAYPGKIKPRTVVNEALGCVDFLPTILSLMDVSSPDSAEGRDASALLTTGKAPEEWKDVVFVRGTGNEAGWLAAVTDRYKLVVSTMDDPWLFDLKEDPDERVNFFENVNYREIARDLASQLSDYGHQRKDPRVSNLPVQADLEWAINGTGEYVSPKRSKPAATRRINVAKGARRRPKQAKTRASRE